MIDPVVHVPSSTHEQFKALCKSQGLRMREVTNRLICDWIVATNRRKKGQTKPSPETLLHRRERGRDRLIKAMIDRKPTPLDPHTAPPFWAGRNGG